MQRRSSRTAITSAVIIVAAMSDTGCSREQRTDTSDQPSALKPNAERTGFDDCSGAKWCPEMISLAGGQVVLGSPSTEPGRFDDEDQKSVTIKPFAIGKYPVTRAQWSSFVDDMKLPISTVPCAYAPNPHPSWKDVGFPQSDEDPVVCITWNDAQEYARWLSKRTGHRYRLPSDGEWEYAARGGTTSAFPWGPRASHAFANYGLDECCGPATVGRDRWEFTSPVGSFPPNAFGLYDMHGNVFEWVETCADPFEKLPLRKDGKGCTYRYARGGAYGERPAMMRSGAKNMAPPSEKELIEDYRSSGFGLRVARND